MPYTDRYATSEPTRADIDAFSPDVATMPAPGLGSAWSTAAVRPLQRAFERAQTTREV